MASPGVRSIGLRYDAAIDRVNTHRDLAESAEKLDFLAHELQHRMNNMLATIGAKRTNEVCKGRRVR